MSAWRIKLGESEPSVCVAVPVGLFAGAYFGLQGAMLVAAMLLAPQPMIFIRCLALSRASKKNAAAYVILHEGLVLLTLAALIFLAFMFLPVLS